MLEECKIDVALMAKPDNISGLEYYPLGEIQDTFVCTPSYLKRLNCNGFEIFERGNIMLLNKDNVSRMHINNYYAENNINPTHILEVNDMDMLIEFAKIGIGVSCVVKQFVKNELSNGSLIEIKLPNAIPPRETGFLYNQNIQPFNDNMLRPCPMLENPQKLRQLINKTGAKSTNLLQPESAEELCSKCDLYAQNWAPKAKEIWEEQERFHPFTQYYRDTPEGKKEFANK